jgi:threonine/homoserine/homoserine lactone efflux protein
MQSQLLPFVGTAVLIALTPGADTALVVRNALASGAREARRTALGSCTGLLVWGVASACGVAALLNASAEVFATLKLAGAAYLIWLGRAGHPARRRIRARRPAPRRLALSPGPAVQPAQPEAGVFFTALLPQFVSPQDPALLVSLLLTAIAAVTSLAWLSVYAALVPRAGDVLRRPRVRRALDRGTGAVLIGLGVRLALTRR